MYPTFPSYARTSTSPLYHDENDNAARMALLANDFIQEENTNEALNDRHLFHLKIYSTLLGCSLGVLAIFALFVETPLIMSICRLLDIDLETKQSLYVAIGIWSINSLVFFLIGLFGLYIFSRLILRRLSADGMPRHVVENVTLLVCRMFALGALLGLLIPEIFLDESCNFWPESAWCVTSSRGKTATTVILTVCVATWYCHETRKKANAKNDKEFDDEYFPMRVVTM